MKALRAWMVRLSGLFSKERREREFAAEIESHVQMQAEDNLRAGMTPEQARREAVLRLGSVESATQAYRERGTVPVVEGVLQDLRFALRQLVKNPGFACTAVLVLALGLGASVAIFAYVDAALIKPLPYQDPSRLVGVFETVTMISHSNLSYQDYVDWKKMNKVFQSLEAWTYAGYSLSTSGGLQLAPGARVSDGFFRVLGITPMLGRDFYAGEDQPSAAHAVMLSYGGWQKWFSGRPGVIGQSITLSGINYTIVGVLPPQFYFAPRGRVDFWSTLQATGPCEKRRSCHNLYGLARLKDGVSVQTAEADTQSIAQQLERQYSDSNRGQGAAVVPLSEVIVGDIRPILLVLLGGAALLLLIACVNVSSLLLVRSESRRREFAVRGAMGASPGRLVRQFATEGCVLVAAGSALGMVLAYATMQLLIRLIPTDVLANMPYLQELGLNLRVPLFALGLSCLAALLFSVTPLLRLSFSDIHNGLSEGGRGYAGTTWRRLGANLVVIELAMAVVLLVGAGLLGKSFYRLLHVDLGFEPDHLATIGVMVPDVGYEKDEQVILPTRKILDQVSTLPGVKSVAVASRLPVTGNGNTTWLRFVGRPFHGEHNEVNERDVSAEYFKTLHARLLRGRYFTEGEDESKPGVAIINRALARQYFPNEDPLGKKIGDTELSTKSLREIVGVVEDVKESSLDSDTWPTIYEPFNQDPDSYFSLVMRTSQTEESVLPAMIATLHHAAPDFATLDEATMSGRIRDSQSAYLHRSSAWLVGGFAGLALLLGAVGLYGVIAYSVSQRTREIGVRMALGAQRGSVYQLIMSEAGWLTGAGILAGLVASVAAATLMRKLLFSVRAWDLSTLLAVAGMLAFSGLLASYIPARRAASVNPVEALRAD